MKVSVFGLGYVGSVSAAAFAADGHDVVGVDVNEDKVAAINAGRSPIVEPGLDALLKAGVESARLRATTNTEDAINSTDLSLICVGTPSRRNGSLDLTYLTRVCEQIGTVLRDKSAYHVVVVRSTVLPGTTHGQVIPALEAASGKKYGEGFGVSVNPEFLREGTAIKDFQNPPLTLVGHNHAADAAPTKALYQNIDAPLFSATIRVAEMIKYTSNTWHAVKIVFANEIGNLCKRLGVDSHDVMDIFCRDEKLNLSSYYLKPGFAFGGSCLPKDLRALNQRACHHDHELPVSGAIVPSNDCHVEEAVRLIERLRRRNVGVLGLSFKAETDDLRESPILRVVSALVGKGYRLLLHDPNLDLERVLGANRRFLEDEVPYLPERLRPTVREVVEGSEVIVIANHSREYREVGALLKPGQAIVDLAHAVDRASVKSGEYHGLAW